MDRKQHIKNLLKEIGFELGDRYRFDVVDGQTNVYGTVEHFLQAWYLEPDTYTKKMDIQYTRKWLISPDATDSQIVQTAFKCVLTSAEHRCREAFKYKGVRVYGPHYDVEDLVELGKKKQWAGAPKKDYKD